MSIMNHSIPSNGHPAFPPNGSGTQDPSHHPPLAPWHSLKPFHPNSSKTTKKTSLNISRGDSIKGTAEYSACSKLPDAENETFRNGIGDLSHLLSAGAEFEPLGLLTDAMVELDRKLSGSGQQQNVAVLKVAVSSAVRLDDTQIDLIARKMRRLTGFVNLRLENVVDPSLIAGFVISYGMGDSHVIDLSVKGQLAALAAKVEFSDKRRVANHGQSWSFSNSIK
ncbi:ATP synthase delta chain, chloroplastic [Iris pallida]|uniref:ATP synthase delta chain, chloroplastic n=1 Tax=Iris pallida TaxID=29817 RepID=A0AAX6IQ48_IRIPA|nr:ATP synthase delta chain, chloroplastic [Iris pallida]